MRRIGVHKEGTSRLLQETSTTRKINITYFGVKKLLSKLSILQTAVSGEVGCNSLKRRKYIQ